MTFGDIEAAWRDLETRADASFFLGWPWISAWLQSIDDRPMVLAARRAATRLSGSPFLVAREHRWRRLLTRRILHVNATGDESQGRCPPSSTTTFSPIAAWRMRCGGNAWRQLEATAHLDGLPVQPASPGAAWRKSRSTLLDRYRKSPDRLGWRRIGRSALGRLSISRPYAADGRPYLEQISANSRRQIRRAIALYQERGRLTLDRARSVEERLALLPRGGRPASTAMDRPRASRVPLAFPFYVAMHERVIARRPAGRGGGVGAGARPAMTAIGYLYNFVYGGRVSFYFGGMRYENDNRLKPGLVTHALCIEDHLAGDNVGLRFHGRRQSLQRPA